MPASKTLFPKILPLVGGALLGAAWFVADAGSYVPIAGVLAAMLAPNMFLAGMGLLALWVSAKVYPASERRSFALAAVLAAILGLNTRIPSYVSDILRGKANDLQITQKIEGAVGQPIRLLASADTLLARQRSYAAAGPDCYGDGCLATKGFRTVSPMHESEYWRQNVREAVLSTGFVVANQSESAATLSVRQDNTQNISTVHLELTDAKGKVLSKYSGRFRNGYPFEVKDGVEHKHSGESHRRLDFLLHGNTLNKLVGWLLVPNGKPYPLTFFLKEATELYHPQGSNLGFASRVPQLGAKLPANVATLDVLDDKVYEPAWRPRGIPDPSGYVSKWQGVPPGDSERHNRCNGLLKPETNAPVMQTWHLFVNDPSGRKKVRITGPTFCDSDALWFLDYVAEDGNVVIAKYHINGDLAYRLSVKKPHPIRGYAGGIQIPTFKADGGFLRFEWWETNHSASKGMEVKRVLKVQVREPDFSL